MIKKIAWSRKNFTDKDIFLNELKTFFSPPVLIDIVNSFKQKNYNIPTHTSNRYIVTKTDSYHLLNNCCLHKNASLVVDDSNIKRNTISCPIHYWAYNIKGDLINAPFTQIDCKSSNLSIRSKKDIYKSLMFLFTNKNIADELSNSKFLKDFKFDEFEIISNEFFEYNGNWKEYGVIFNDSTHVKFFHPEMSEVVNLDSIEWETNENYVAHRVKLSNNWMLKDNNRFTKFLKLIEKKGESIKNDEINDYIVTWINIFPNVFLDLWPGFVDIVIVEPISVDKFKIHNITLCKNSLLNDKNIQDLYVEALGNVEFEDNVILKKVHEGITNTTENEIYEEYINCLTELGGVDYINWLHNKGNGIYGDIFSIESY